MCDIVLVALNARWAHSSLGSRCLLANLGPMRDRARIEEFDLDARPLDVVERILAGGPRIVGIGVYVWNVALATQVAAALRAAAPHVRIVLGGPEISHETQGQEILRHAHHVIRGEGDLEFARLCGQLLGDSVAGPSSPILPHAAIIDAAPVDLARVELPYDLYDPRDLSGRVVYVESSRGCPFGCEFCLSSLDPGLRLVPLERFLPAMQRLLDGGAAHIKFVDRTLNANTPHAARVLEFFADRQQPGLLVHFEMIPDQLPEALRRPIQRFAPGTLQLEVGVQTFNADVAVRIGRRQNNALAEENLRWLRTHTHAHLHADLIVGLPGEDLSSFAAGFDRLVSIGPQEIQVGILKRLRGAPIARHDGAWGMAWNPHAPYEVLRTNCIGFAAMQEMRRFARYWDMLANSGRFGRTMKLVLDGGSAFEAFLGLSRFLWQRLGRAHAIARDELAARVGQWLLSRGHDARRVSEALAGDRRAADASSSRRQARHMVGR
jgi:radical SAM superfamily enzyme YgiQ (UPF0313 family)